MKGSGVQVPEDSKHVLEEARKVIMTEIEGLKQVSSQLDESFVDAIDLILKAKGRVIITGIGKSGLIGRKIAATMASTGTPAMFLHPVEAAHGDLGMVGPDDIVIALSNSGETQELNALLPVFAQRNIPIIAITGNRNSTLSRNSTVTINSKVDREACALGLAPTTSTTATLALGDALAVVLLEKRRFGEEDFRRCHPAGTLGERLKVQVSQVMLTGMDLPLARLGSGMADALKEMNKKGHGAVLVLDGDEVLVGIVTDGDLRRAMVSGIDIKQCTVDQIMTRNPKTTYPDAMAAEALELMEKFLITVLPVVDSQRHLVGIVHLHDLLGKGQFRFVI